MKLNIRNATSRVAFLTVVVAVIATALVVPAASAGDGGRTQTVRTVKVRGSGWIAGGGKMMSPGHLSAGNRLFETSTVRRDDGATGVVVATVMVASPGTVSAKRAVGLMRAVYRFGDGDIYVDGFVSFARPSGTGVVVGGTGAYKGVTGTFTSTEAKDVFHLLS
jgi:hypothetical protein